MVSRAYKAHVYCLFHGMEYALRILPEVGHIVSEAIACTDQKRKEELLQKLVDKINLAVEKYGFDPENEDSEVEVDDSNGK